MLSGVSPRTHELQQRLAAFGDSVRTARRASGLSQEELAHAAGLHRTYIGSVERGERNITIGNAWAVADALHISLRELLDSG